MSQTKGQSNLWSKFKSGTKSLSSSIQHLAVKQEQDGDTVTSTLVHKALVKYYSSQEPFQGYPGWLGHVSEGPEDKSSTVKQKIAGTFSGSRHSSTGSTEPGHLEQRRLPNEHPGALSERRTPGSSTFRGIVASTNSNVDLTQNNSQFLSGSHRVESQHSSNTASRPTLDTQSQSSQLNRYDSVSSRLMQSRLRMNRINSSSTLER